MSRLDDTSRCPKADRCETCGGVDGLAVTTAQTVVGVLCQTLCRDCADAGDVTPLSAPATVARVLGHHLHTGTTTDQT